MTRGTHRVEVCAVRDARELGGVLRRDLDAQNVEHVRDVPDGRVGRVLRHVADERRELDERRRVLNRGERVRVGGVHDDGAADVARRVEDAAGVERRGRCGRRRGGVRGGDEQSEAEEANHYTE